MKKNILLSAVSAILFVLLSTNLFAQNDNQQAAPKIIKPKPYAMDFLFCYQLLNTIELRGSEVDALLEVKNTLKPFIDKIQADNIPMNNVVTFDISVPVAYNFLQFLERGKFTGADAEKYKRFVNSINEAFKTSG
ncbi:MAG: hypothetical protein WC313_02850 [Candidatus Kapaibacterium sp.]|jgi:hypothetical protein|nr:hypothetical protein [Candidatus Kapabacteria bacterium]